MILEDVTVVTSPLRQYLKLDWQQLVGLFGVDPRYLRYTIEGQYPHSVLLEFSSDCQDELRGRAKELGLQLRFKAEYLPRLEEERWRKMNKIIEVTSV